MDKQRVLNRSRNYGILFCVVFCLSIIDFTNSEAFMLIAKFASIVLWFSFIDNLVSYYDDTKINKLNIFIALFMIVIFFWDLFMGLGNSPITIVIFILPKIISMILLFVLFIMLGRRTQVKEFYLVILLYIVYRVAKYKTNFIYALKYEYAFYGANFLILAVLLFAILKFYKKESLHVEDNL